MKFKDDIVLITGSNGRIGTAVMQRLRKRFDNVVGFDQKAATPPPPDCVAIPVDITSDESVREGLRILREHHGAKIAAVVHLAAYYDFLGNYFSMPGSGPYRIEVRIRLPGKAREVRAVFTWARS